MRSCFAFVAVLVVVGCSVKGSVPVPVSAVGSSSSSKTTAPAAPRKATEVAFSNQTGVRALVLDGDDLLWVNGYGPKNDNGHTVMRAPQKGGPIKAIATIAETPLTLAVDDKNVYFSALDANAATDKPLTKIYRAPKMGGAPSVVLDRIGDVSDLVSDDTFLYFVGFGGVFRVAKAGGAPSVLDGSLRAYTGLVVDDRRCYFGATKGAGHLFAIPKEGGPPTQLGTRSGVGAIAKVGSSLVFNGLSTLYKIGTDGSGETVLGSTPGVGWLAVEDGSIYGVGQDDAVWSLPLAGAAGATANVIGKGAQSQHGIAASAKYVFWADSTAGTITRMAR